MLDHDINECAARYIVARNLDHSGLGGSKHDQSCLSLLPTPVLHCNNKNLLGWPRY